MLKKLLLLLLFLPFSGFSQVSPKDSVINTPMINLSYSLQFPGGDMAERYGFNHNMGAHYWHKTRKNFFFGVEWNMLFGDKIKESGILDSLRTDNGNILDKNGEYSIIRLFERGHQINLRFGKLFSFGWPNQNSGILLNGGIGYLQHKIKIDDIGKRTPNLNPDYKKGYDRLTAGVAFTQSLGFLFLSNNRLTNFFLVMDFTQAYTQSMRSFNFDTETKDTQKRWDLLFGPRFGVIIPLYKKLPNEFYYN